VCAGERGDLEVPGAIARRVNHKGWFSVEGERSCTEAPGDTRNVGVSKPRPADRGCVLPRGCDSASTGLHLAAETRQQLQGFDFRSRSRWTVSPMDVRSPKAV